MDYPAIIKYPMVLNKTWNYTGTVTVPSAGVTSTTMDAVATLKVAAFESVKTKVGTFKAYRVDLDLTVKSAGGSRQLSNSYWFALVYGMSI